jgi:hypothetical protein
VLTAARALLGWSSRGPAGALLWHRGYRAARVAFNRPIGARGARRASFLVAGFLTIIFWQLAFVGRKAFVDDAFKITAASGVHQEKDFVYFLYYLNLFPVVETTAVPCTSPLPQACRQIVDPPGEYSADAARAAMVRNGGSLQQDFGWTWYAGDRGKIYLYLFDAWLKGAPRNTTPRPASRVLFTGSLCALFASMWWVRRALLGVCLALFLGSNPFQLFEVYGNDNVFGLSISTALLLLAIHVPLLRPHCRPNARWVFLWPLGVGALMATIRTMRSEPMAMLVAPAATYLVVAGLPLRRRAALVVTLAASFWLVGALWNAHFVRQQRHAAEVVAGHGGHPFTEDIRLYHHFWHPIWCGLGDFDDRHGYEWNDHAAAGYARPRLQLKGVYVPTAFMNVPEGDPREYFDPKTKIYKKLPYELPYYNDIIRDKVLADIRNDPWWYLGILAKRVKRVFTMTTPVRISWWRGWLTLPWHAALVVPTVVLLALARSRFLLRIILFTVPTVATAVAVFSDRGMTYYGIFHVVSFAVVLTVALQHAVYHAGRARALRRALEHFRARARSQRRPSPSAHG